MTFRTTSLAAVVVLITSIQAFSAPELQRISTRRCVGAAYALNVDDLRKAVISSYTNLYGVKSCTPMRLSPRTSKRSQKLGLENEVFSCFWTPPNLPVRKVSEGGKVQSLESELTIVIVYARSNPALSYVSLVREWRQIQTLHIPFTEIPAGHTSGTEFGIYSCDVDWLKKLSTKELEHLSFGSAFDDLDFTDWLVESDSAEHSKSNSR